MAYVESFYLEQPNADVYNDTVEVQPIPSIQNLLEQDVVVTTKPAPVSDYCGFESDEIPPIYRAQLRAVQKKKILAAENADKSVYAYAVEEEGVAKKEESKVKGEIQEEVKNMAPITGPQSVEYYVPGFSPPPQNDGDTEVQKRADFSLPKMKAIEATENVFNITGKHEASQYVLMENEDPKKAMMTKSVMESLISYTDVGSTASDDSCLTATLGPAYGYLPAVDTQRPTDVKYKGLSAFRPVTQSVQSQYASLELN